MKIVVLGAGYVGLVTGACLADMGHDVVVLDPDTDKIETLLNGGVPIHEPGLAELIKNPAGSITFRHLELSNSIDAEAVYIAVGTPQGDDGQADLSHVMSAANWIEANSDSMKKLMVIIKSTVPPGTASKVRKIVGNFNRSVISNPEFLKEGDAIRDFKQPDRIVAGFENMNLPEVGPESPQNRFFRIYINADIHRSKLLYMSNESAELAKYANNGMLATRISFMNEMSRLAYKVGADIDSVKLAVGADNRIGTPFLNAGPGWGGSCFPKDLRALAAIGEHDICGTDSQVVEASILTNTIQKEFIVQRCMEILGGQGDFKGKQIAVFGLAFKPNTDDTRESPAIDIVNHLTALGAMCFLHDPVACLPEDTIKPSNVGFCSDRVTAAMGTDLVLLLTDWDEYKDMSNQDWAEIRGVMRTPQFFDTRNCLDVKKVGLGTMLHRL